MNDDIKKEIMNLMMRLERSEDIAALEECEKYARMIVDGLNEIL